MQQMIKRFFWIALLMFSWQTAWAYSLLGPRGAGEDASEQIPEIGYNPLTLTAAPPFFGDTQNPPTGPRNLGEGYRLNTPVLYYTFDSSFDYFGSNGEAAVEEAFDTMNSLTNVDSYSTNLTEFPLNSESINYTAQTLGLEDLKSTTLSIILEEMGLADPVRYTWVLLDRDNSAVGAACPAGGPSVNYTYWVGQRNYDIISTPLNYNAPDVGQYSPYVNDELYSYFIYDNCDLAGASPPTADAVEIPADPLNKNPPVASGHGEDSLPPGAFYTGLTRDDVAGLRYLISTNNSFSSLFNNYIEASPAGSALLSTNLSALTTNITSDLHLLVSDALTTDPATMQTLFPGLELASTNYYFTNVPVITAYLTNFLKGDAGAPPALFVGVTTNVEQIYQYTFANVVTNSFNTSTIVTNETIQTVQAGNGFILQTNYSRIRTNLLTGDYFIIPTGGCPPDIFQTLQANVITATNTLISTNIVGTNGVSYFYSQSLIYHYTNHVFEVAPCTLQTNVPGTYQGVGKIQFVRVADNNYDSLLGQFFQAITNQYNMVVMTNGRAINETFQRVVTRPDILFMGENLSQGGNDAIFLLNEFSRTTPNFINSRAAAGLAGPGIIDPTTSSNIVVTFNTVGPLYDNSSPSELTGPNARYPFLWGSFDGTTNPPVVYPNGTSIANLENEALMQITPTTLPDATNGVPYNVTLSAKGGTPPYTWSLASGSAALPAGLSLSSGGMISGTPAQSGTFDDIAIQVVDSSYPTPLAVQINYSITIN